MSKAIATRKEDYFRLPRLLWRKVKTCLPKERRRQVEGLRVGCRQRPLVRALDRLPVEGGSSGLVWGLLERYSRTFREMDEDERPQEAGEADSLVLAKERGVIGCKWQAMDSKNTPAPLGDRRTGKNPTDRGKRGAKRNLMVDQSGAPLSVVLTGANRHDKVVAIDLIVSMVVKRPAHKEQHLCADKAYDATDVRKFAASGGYTTHIKMNARKKGATESSDEFSQEKSSSREPHPARRWVVERTIS